MVAGAVVGRGAARKQLRRLERAAAAAAASRAQSEAMLARDSTYAATAADGTVDGMLSADWVSGIGVVSAVEVEDLEEVGRFCDGIVRKSSLES
jgi:hypothetical protein